MTWIANDLSSGLTAHVSFPLTVPVAPRLIPERWP
jgi:hypothetical protein